MNYFKAHKIAQRARISLEEHVDVNNTIAPEDTDVSVEPTDDVANSDNASYQNEGNLDIDISLEESTLIHKGPQGVNIDGTSFDEVSGTYKRFVLTGFDATSNPSAEDHDIKDRLVILMQHGLVKDGVMNGVTVNDLLKVCQNLMEGYQSTKFACEENAQALAGINSALEALEARANRRTDQGVINTHVGENEID